MNGLVALIRRLLGLEQDVEKILKPISRIVEQLDTHGADQFSSANKKTIDAGRLLAEAEEAREVAKKALTLKDNFASLLGNLQN